MPTTRQRRQTDYLSEDQTEPSVWLHYRRDYPFRFYVWASLIEDGRVVATDYAPDVGWLDPLPEPDLRLVGPSWALESLRTDGVTTTVPGGAGATLTFEPDGDMEIDAACGPDGDAATFRRRLTRTLDNTLRMTPLYDVERRCGGSSFILGPAIFELFEDGEVTYSVDDGVLRLSTDRRAALFKATDSV